MNTNNVTFAVLIKGSIPAREYISPMDRNTYIEGREGSEFTLRIKNNNGFRVCAIPSVDGLSIFDGKPAGAHSTGMVLDAYGTVDIPGWKVDSKVAAKFIFAGEKANGDDASYVGQIGGDTRNKGILGLRVYREKVTYRNDLAYARGIAPSGWRGAFGSSAADVPKGIGPTWSMNNATLSASSSAIQPDATPLGTGFGDATEFHTTKVTFDRGDLVTEMVLRYADKRELKKRGIDIDFPVNEGSAFPADDAGCQPPAGWSL